MIARNLNLDLYLKKELQGHDCCCLKVWKYLQNVKATVEAFVAKGMIYDFNL